MARISFLRTAGTTLIAASLPGLAWAQQTPGQGGYGYGYGPHMMWGGGWYGMAFGPVLMILILAAVIITIVYLLRSLSHAPHHHAPPPYPHVRSALDILKERFARGEIDKAEFEERRRVLGD